MDVKVGTDILRLKRFLTSLQKGGDSFKERVFTPQELNQNSPEQLASIFCLKEAVIKAMELPQDSWLMINTNRKTNGKVDCSFLDSRVSKKIVSLDTSISHDGGLILAVVVILLK